MKREFTYQRSDWFIAAFLAVFVCLLIGVRLTPGMPNWGDDFAAYLSEGIAISNGDFHEQVAINGNMYMAELTQEAQEKGLVYVWGFPLLLALVNRLAGFDLLGYSNVILYKLPSLLAFAGTAMVLYLFYRRFFPAVVSLFLTLLLSLSENFVYSIDILNVDVVFLFAEMLSFLLAECYFDASTGTRKKHILGILLGLALWFTYETRLNGNTILMVIILAHGIRLLQEKKRLSFVMVLEQLCPYILFLSVKVISETILAPATSNVSHVGALPMDLIASNARYYYDLTMDFLKGISNYGRLYDILRITLLVGLVVEAFRFKNLSYTVLLVGTYAVLILLPYTQGLRYLYGVLPLLLLYAGHGCMVIARLLLRFLPMADRMKKPVSLVLSVLMVSYLLTICVPEVQKSFALLNEEKNVNQDDVYSADAVDMYRYIQENTAEDAVVIFIKTRAVHLNTGRLSIYPGFHGQTMEDADYYLYCHAVNCDLDYWYRLELGSMAPPVYQNEMFELYRIDNVPESLE